MRTFVLRFICFAFAACLLSGCTIIDNAKRYETGLKFTSLNEDLTKRYRNSPGSEPALYLPASKKFAYLEEDTGDLFIKHAYMTKKSLSEWDGIFQRFLDWKSSPGESITLTDPITIKNSLNPLDMDQDLKFVNIKGEKYLVFTTYEWYPISNYIFAYDVENVVIMKHLFKSLNYVLVD